MVTCQVRNWKKFYQNILINAETSLRFVTGMCLSCNWILYLYLQYRKISDCQVGIPLFQVKHQIWTDLVVWTGVDSKLKTENIKYLNTVNSQLLLLILHRLPRQYWAKRVKSSLCLNTESLTTDYLYPLSPPSYCEHKRKWWRYLDYRDPDLVVLSDQQLTVVCIDRCQWPLLSSPVSLFKTPDCVTSRLR